MAKSKLLSYALLYPISKIYGLVMSIRNFLFDQGMLEQHKFDIPVVVVGNISMGGSGKTPHTEYIVDALRDDYKIGVLSRGYKRKTKGFVLATDDSHVDDIGDEPYQIYQKFKHYGVTVAVCANRVKGIEEMRRLVPDLDLIVLDDAFQHRYVKPSVSVVLMEYNRPAYSDHILPFGHLREPMRALNRADVVIVTKCPNDMKPMETRIFKTNLNLFPFQKLLFSSYNYLDLKPVFTMPGKQQCIKPSEMSASDSILAVTGVANPRPFVRYLRKSGAKVRIKRYADHHHFTHSDMQSIQERFNTMPGERKFIITTEKDAVRLRSNPYFPPELRDFTFYIPIEVNFDNFNSMSLAEVLKQLLRTERVLKRN